MPNRQIRLYVFLVLILVLVVVAAPAYARGDRVIPQVADGGGIVTKFDLLNLSDAQVISAFKLRFFHQDGTAWNIQTTLGTGSEFVVNMNPHQRLRIETLGLSSPQTAGYAVIRDDESVNTIHAMDLILGITAYYATTSGGSITSVVSVPASPFTKVFSIPVEMNDSSGIYTGIAIVNLAGVANKVTFNLYAATDPPTGAVGSPQTSSITLQPGQQRAEFLHQFIYPGTINFKGQLEGLAEGPVSILGLSQVTTTTGVQYASISPTLTDHLRQNTHMLLLQPETDVTKQYYPFDLDDIRTDYFQDDSKNEGVSWDLRYETLRGGGRQLTPVNGAGLVSLGKLDYDPFDNVTLADLRSKTYSTSTPIDLSNIKFPDDWGTSFAVRTNLGNYAKIHVIRIIDTVDASGNKFVDLGLEVYVYK